MRRGEMVPGTRRIEACSIRLNGTRNCGARCWIFRGVRAHCTVWGRGAINGTARPKRDAQRPTMPCGDDVTGVGIDLDGGAHRLRMP
jgi:hypothetical protein